jgi:hypothetical protein
MVGPCEGGTLGASVKRGLNGFVGSTVGRKVGLDVALQNVSAAWAFEKPSRQLQLIGDKMGEEAMVLAPTTSDARSGAVPSQEKLPESEAAVLPLIVCALFA